MAREGLLMKYNNDHAPDKEVNSENDDKYEYLKK